MGFEPVPLRTNGTNKAMTIGATETVLVREDQTVAYPVVDGVPVLLAPEALGAPALAGYFDLDQSAFQEAYLEMDFYNEVGTRQAAEITSSEAWQALDDLVRLTDGNPETMLSPPVAWLDAIYDSASQADAYAALMPIRERTFAQIGGKGIHAIKFLLAGATQAWLITPMLGEAQCAFALAAEFGVQDRLQCVVAVGEQLPVRDKFFDGIYVGGSVHHMDTELAMPEAKRVLSSGGVFSAVEPFRAPLYGIGTRVMGKRETEVHCIPLDEARIGPFLEAFDDAQVVHHGALTRYPLLALSKLGVRLPFRAVWRINSADDTFSDRVSSLRGAGSSICLVGRT